MKWLPIWKMDPKANLIHRIGCRCVTRSYDDLSALGAVARLSLGSDCQHIHLATGKGSDFTESGVCRAAGGLTVGKFQRGGVAQSSNTLIPHHTDCTSVTAH